MSDTFPAPVAVTAPPGPTFTLPVTLDTITLPVVATKFPELAVMFPLRALTPFVATTLAPA